MAQVLQLGALGDNAALLCRPEHLLKVQGLALVGDIEDLVRGVVPLPLNQSGKIRGGVDGGAVGLDQDTGRYLFPVCGLCHGEDQGALAFHGEAPLLEIRQHIRNQGVRVAFTQPHIKVNIQGVIYPVQVGKGYVHNMLPDSPVAGAALLKLEGSDVGFPGEFFVLLFPGGGGGVDFLQLRQGKGRLRGVGAGKGFVKIRKLRLPAVKLGDDQAHLQAPVAQVDIPDGPVA